MKVKFIASLCGGSKDYHPGDEQDIEDTEALRLIDSGIVVAKNKKEYEQVLANIEKSNHDKAEKEAQRTAVIEKETLTAELRDLYAQVARKVAQIEGVILSDEEVEEFVEKSMKGEDPASDTGNFPAGKSDEENKAELDANNDKKSDENVTGSEVK